MAASNESQRRWGGIGPSISRIAAGIVKLVSVALARSRFQRLGDGTREVRGVLVEHRDELFEDRIED